VSTSRQSEPDQRYHHGDLRRALLAAAREMLEESGPEALSLRDVARRVGVSHNAPYRHFPTRQALLAAVAAEGFAALSARMASLPESAPGFAAGFRAYLGFARAQPGLFRLMFDGTLEKSADPALWAAGEQAYDGLRQAVLSVAPRADRAAVVAAWAQLHGLALLAITGQISEELMRDDGADILADRAAAILEAGLREAAAPPGTPGPEMEQKF